jgi:hypothetical protein
MVNSLPNIGGGKAACRENFRARAYVRSECPPKSWRAQVAKISGCLFFMKWLRYFFLAIEIFK